jgi:plastocyanin
VTASIANFAFSPANLTVPKGTTVTWTNKDSAPHTVTDDGGAFSSATLGDGDTFSLRFTSAGTFAYHCAVHPSMTGVVAVSD